MNRREKCELLRAIRQNIAELNGIDYVQRECKHTECVIGTCPLCEEEAGRFMEKIRRKEASGSPIRIDFESLFELDCLLRTMPDDEDDLIEESPKSLQSKILYFCPDENTDEGRM